MSPKPEYVQTDAIAAPIGAYSHLSRAGDLVFIAGQIGVDADGNLVGSDVVSQARQTFANIEALLHSQSAGMRNLVRLTTYVCDRAADDGLAGFCAVRDDVYAAAFPDGRYPAHSLAVVAGLAQPKVLVEIDGVASIPLR